ncbi:MAG: hypothetical protein HRT88_09090 [Lentisphaeraceae bacterium]|nr:hypothetical protein [Lentisphaeraceae bacterium]
MLKKFIGGIGFGIAVSFSLICLVLSRMEGGIDSGDVLAAGSGLVAVCALIFAKISAAQQLEYARDSQDIQNKHNRLTLEPFLTSDVTQGSHPFTLKVSVINKGMGSARITSFIVKDATGDKIDFYEWKKHLQNKHIGGGGFAAPDMMSVSCKPRDLIYCEVASQEEFNKIMKWFQAFSFTIEYENMYGEKAKDFVFPEETPQG